MSATRTLSIKAVGDICLHGVAGDPFAHVADALAADVLFGNLECCLTTRGDTTKVGVSFAANPASARHLAEHGFDVVCLANNHVLDYGPAGLTDTLDVLDAHGLFHVGAGRNDTEATTTRVREAGGVRVAVVSSVDASGGDGAGPTVSVLSIRAMAAKIREARTAADVVIASYHGGIELDTAPTPFMIRSLRSLVDAGADVVLGHHPHVLQPAEVYKGRVIAYSLGNFVFDNRRYGEHAELASVSTILDVSVILGAAGVEEVTYRYLPVRIEDDFLPRVVTGEPASGFEAYMKDLERTLAGIRLDGLDVDRLQNITREVHQKSFKTLVRYAVRHMGDFTFREMVVGAWMVLRNMVRRKGGA